MSDRKFSEEHEWIQVEDDIGTVGITDYAQEQLDVDHVAELPEIGVEVERGAEVAVVESAKAASEVYSPVSGQVVEVNETLSENPALVNEDAMGEGWFFKIRLSVPAELDELMDEAGYKAFVEGLD